MSFDTLQIATNFPSLNRRDKLRLGVSKEAKLKVSVQKAKIKAFRHPPFANKINIYFLNLRAVRSCRSLRGRLVLPPPLAVRFLSVFSE